MLILKKHLGLIVFALFILGLPSLTNARDATNFKTHCSKDVQFNDFGTIASIPPILNTPLAESDNGGWVALYEILEDTAGSLDLEFQGTVDSDEDYVTVCEGGSVVAIIPTYKQAETDTNRVFKLAYTLTFGVGGDVAIDNPSYYTSKDSKSSLNAVTNWNDVSRSFEELASLDPTSIVSKSNEFEALLGGVAYHEVYATYAPPSQPLQTEGFSLENFDNISTLNYAIFPPLETLSGCNASSLQQLNVEDVKCFSMERQVEFRKYFLGLPEVIQRLFDFASDVDDEPASVDGVRKLMVNYFNGQSVDDDALTAAPATGEYLSISVSNNKYRYSPLFTGTLDDLEMENGLTSYHEECKALSPYPSPAYDTCYKTDKNCKVTMLDVVSEIGSAMIVNGLDGTCADGGFLPTLTTDATALLTHVGVNDDTDPKVMALSDINERTNTLCTDINANVGITDLQALNASAIAMTQYLADLDARYEGFGACEKISAINTLSGMMDRTLEVLGR